MELILLIVMGAGVGAAVGSALWWNSKQAEKRDDAWRRFALDRGGAFTEGKFGMLKVVYPAIDLVVGHAVVRIDIHAVQAGKNRRYYTRARARYALGVGAVFSVSPEGITQTLTKVLGAQDVVLGGDDPFDDVFIVKCDDVEATRAVWTPQAKTLMRSRFERRRVIGDGSAVCLLHFGQVTDPRVLGAMVELVGQLASVGGDVLERYAALENAELTAVQGPFARHTPPQLTVETDRGPARIQVLMSPGAPRVRVQLSHELDLRPFSIDVVDSEVVGAPQGMISERAQQLVERLGPFTLVGNESTLSIAWPGAPRLEAMQKALTLLAELAAGNRSEGAFR